MRSPSSSAKKQFSRSPRMQSHPEEFNNFVRYGMDLDPTRANTLPQEPQAKNLNNDEQPAQFTDVSETGMRLVSRHPNQAQVGDPLVVEFTVPGSDKKIKNQAFVVRRVNEFIFAVRFEALQDDERHRLRRAISRYTRPGYWRAITRARRQLGSWSSRHQQGLILFLAASLIAGALAVHLFFSSDWYQGRPMKAWGNAVPREWALEYFKHFHQPDKP